MSNKEVVTIKKPIKNKIGIIPFNTDKLSNDLMDLDMTNFFLKESKYFTTFEKKISINENQQIIDYLKKTYKIKINEQNIHYYGSKGNVMIYLIKIKNKNNINEGRLSDLTPKKEYSWKIFYNINFEKNDKIYDNILDNKYNLHVNNSLISEKKKTKNFIRRIIYFLKRY